MPASGLRLTQFQDRPRAQLAAGDLRNPQIQVDADQYKSQSVFVGGEVRAPGKVTMSGTMTLPEALAAAGSPLSSASNDVIITHVPSRPPPASFGAATPGAAGFGTCVMITSLLAEESGEPAAASASGSVIVPLIVTLPGARTSPPTKTLWLLY